MPVLEYLQKEQGLEKKKKSRKVYLREVWGRKKMTQIAKFLRKLRIDCDESLGDMADKLGLSAAYLSAIENGKRNAPEDMSDRLFAAYVLSEEQKREFTKILAQSRNRLVIPLGDMQQEFFPERVDAAVVFAHELSHMNEAQLLEVRRLLEKIGEEMK